MRIESLRPSRRVPGRWVATLADGSTLHLQPDQISGFGLQAGQDLSEEDLSHLRSAARRSNLQAYALRLLGNAPLSRRALTDRLKKQECPEEEAEEIADWLEEMGFLNDRQYAADVVRSYGNRGYGPARIREELRRRGISRDLWDEAMQALPEQEETLDRLIEKKSRGDLSDPKEVRRLSGALLRRGFSWSEVKEALRRYAEIDEDV